MESEITVEHEKQPGSSFDKVSAVVMISARDDSSTSENWPVVTFELFRYTPGERGESTKELARSLFKHSTRLWLKVFLLELTDHEVFYNLVSHV